MFETLHDLSPLDLESAADALHADGVILICVDPSGVCMLFRACRDHGSDVAPWKV